MKTKRNKRLIDYQWFFKYLSQDIMHVPFKWISDVVIPIINPFIKQGLKSNCPIPLENRPVNLRFDISMLTEPTMLN